MKKLSCLRTSPSHLYFQCQIVFNMLLVDLARTNTSLFVTFVQLIFSILHHIHILNASNSSACVTKNEITRLQGIFYTIRLLSVLTKIIRRHNEQMDYCNKAATANRDNTQVA